MKTLCLLAYEVIFGHHPSLFSILFLRDYMVIFVVMKAGFFPTRATFTEW